MLEHDFGPLVTSPHNPSIRYARSLQRRKARQRERAFLVEGPRLIADAVARTAQPETVFVDHEAGEEITNLARRLAESGSRTIPVSHQLIDLLSDTQTPQGIVATFAVPELPLTTLDAPLFVVADQIRDPGNLGTLMRSALAAGCTAILIAPGTVDPFSSKVVRAAMGAHFGLPVRWMNWVDPPSWMPNNTRWYVAEASGTSAYDRVDWTVPACLVVGGETEGTSEPARARAAARVRIPLSHQVESLNAGVAGSVILFEADRQRRARGLREDSMESRVCTRETG